jgi:hypothetical protein
MTIITSIFILFLLISKRNKRLKKEGIQNDMDPNFEHYSLDLKFQKNSFLHTEDGFGKMEEGVEK